MTPLRIRSEPPPMDAFRVGLRRELARLRRHAKFSPSTKRQLSDKSAGQRVELGMVTSVQSVTESPGTRVLTRAISELSESQWCATWNSGIEHMLWEADQGWRDVAKQLGCWVAWDDGGPVRVSLDVWEQRHEEWRGQQSAEALAWIHERAQSLAP